MKRSEMQRILSGLLSTMYETNMHPEGQMRRADKILSVLEDLGMKPPVQKRCPVLLTQINTWEPEDDLRNSRQ